MKYVSFVIPSYNSEKFLNKAVDSLLPAKSDIEIIIVNDGSKDNTIKIAKEYEAKYPDCVRVIDKENGGHGSGINAGLKIATGLYFKVIDSDDWADTEGLPKYIETIKANHKNKINPDLYFTKFLFDRFDDGELFEHDLHKKFPKNRMFKFNEIQNFQVYEYIMLHMLTYKTELLKKMDLHCPEKVFYEDNYFNYAPLPYVETMYFIDINFYHYYVGRQGQSISIENMRKNYKHYVTVLEETCKIHKFNELKTLEKKKFKFITHEFLIIWSLTMFNVTISGDPLKLWKPFKKWFKENDPEYYKFLAHKTPYFFMRMLPKPILKIVCKVGYKIMQKASGWY